MVQPDWFKLSNE